MPQEKGRGEKGKEESAIEKTRAILAADDRSILIPAWRNEASEEVLALFLILPPPLIPNHPRFLPSPPSPRSRGRFPRRCAHGNRSLEQDSIGIRLHPPSSPFPPRIPFLLFPLAHVYAEKYLPFSNNTPRLIHPRTQRVRWVRVRVLIRGVILHSKFIRLSVPAHLHPPLFQAIFRRSLSSPVGDAAEARRSLLDKYFYSLLKLANALLAYPLGPAPPRRIPRIFAPVFI